MRKYTWPATILGILCLAGALRLPRLPDRPMHADEAVLADKFGTLLETGVYTYNPHDYHGPALLYATLIPARLRGIHSYADLDETVLRVVPVLFGLAMVALPLLLADALGRATVIAASGLIAVSPAMVYYSRYYIPEMLLACCLLGVVVFTHRYARTGRTRWAVFAGASLGVALAAKETAVLAVVAMVLALALTTRKLGEYRALVAGLCTALLVFAVLITSFLQHPTAVADYVRALFNYWGRAFDRGPHVHAWHYYLGLLLRAEVVIAALAAVGTTELCKRKSTQLLRFLFWYTAILTVLYSAMPYKTPWCVLGPLTGMALLAGAGAARLFRWRKLGALVMMAAAAVEMYAAGSGTYVYSQTGRDVYAICDKLEALAAVHPNGHAMPVAIFTQENLWPLPWYLRSFTAVRWWTGVPHQKPPAPVLLASPDMEPALTRMVYEYPPPGERELYMNMFERRIELRPAVEVRGYVASSLWKRLSAHSQQRPR